MAHEIGHFLGMEHDFHENHEGKNCVKDNHLMTYAKLPEMVKWSSCSKADFQAYYLMTQKEGWKWCMEGNSLIL